MAIIVERSHSIGIHPVQGALLAGLVTLFLGALLTDIAYAKTYEIQWSNFASWLLVGGLVIGAVALVWAVVDLVRYDRRAGRDWVHALVVLATWVTGLFAALVHGKDAWAMMPGGLVLSAIATVLALIATWIGFSRRRVEVTP
ncbi:MAG TPA: DUF2231 domain-containing protein [Qipengyuania sp.]|nr:DUF2231 domain-containing protein [Qipengyuania sp.]